MAVAILNMPFSQGTGVFYDWTNAVSDSYKYDKNTVVLYQLGCLVDEQAENLSWDCFSACQDPEKLWNSSFSAYTLHNCIASISLSRHGHALTYARCIRWSPIFGTTAT